MKMKNNQKIPVSILADREVFEYLKAVSYTHLSVDAEFTSRWVYPEEEIDRLIASLEAKDKTYIKIPSYEFADEYVSFRIFSQGKWDITL